MKKIYISKIPVLISLVTICFPVLGALFLLLAILREKRYSRIYALPFSLIYGVIGYNQFCKYQPDLVRYLAQIEAYNKTDILSILMNDKGMLYTRDIIFYFVARTGEPYVLPFLVGMIVYMIVFYVLFDSIRRYSLLSIRGGRGYALLIGMMAVGVPSTFSIISNVRCVLAFVLISFACYREFVERKRNIFTLILYIVPLGLHTAAVVLLLFRILYFMYSKLSRVLICIVFLLPVIINSLYILLRGVNGLGIIKYAVDKAYKYLHWTEGGYADEVYNNISTWIERLYGIPFLIIILVYVLKLQNEKEDGVEDRQEYIKFYYVMIVFALGCLWIKTGAFWRFEALVALFSPTVLVPIVVKGKYNALGMRIYLFSGVIMFVLNAIMFISWVDMKAFVEGILFTSIWEIIVKMFYAL